MTAPNHGMHSEVDAGIWFTNETKLLLRLQAEVTKMCMCLFVRVV